MVFSLSHYCALKRDGIPPWIQAVLVARRPVRNPRCNRAPIERGQSLYLQLMAARETNRAAEVKPRGAVEAGTPRNAGFARRWRVEEDTRFPSLPSPPSRELPSAVLILDGAEFLGFRRQFLDS